MKFRFLLITLFICSIALAQTKGTISGVLTDKDLNNAALPFANAVIKGTAFSTTTDENGKYSISLLPGNYTIVFSFLGYENIEIPFSLKENEKITINKALGSGSYQLTDVVVKSTSNREKETALLLDQKKAVEIKQSIGAQEMSRKGVSDVEEGLTKITGITKVGSRGIFVRGLEDRYNNLLVNDLAVPSNNPFKKIIPLDLFPTDIVGVIDVYKTFNPNIYGDFAGGTFNIVTSKGTSKSITKLNIGAGYTTDNNLADFNIDKSITDSKGFFGFAGNDRKLPSIFGNTPTNMTLSSTESLKYLNKGFDVKNMKSPLNSSVGILHSEKFSLKNSANFTYLLSLNFDNNYSVRKGVDRTVYGSADEIIYNNNFNSSEYKYKTNTSALVGLNYKTDRFDLSSSTFYLKNTENSIKDQLGIQGQQVNNPNYLIRTNQLDQSDYLTTQLNGKYFLTSNKNQSIKAGLSYSKTSFDQPDRKFFGGTLQDNGEIITSYTGNNFLRQYLSIDGSYYISGLGEYNLKFGKKEKKDELTFGFNGNSSETQSSYRFVVAVTSSYPQFTTNLNNIDTRVNADLAAGNFNFKESSNAQYKVKLFEYTNAGFTNLLLHFGEKWEVNGGIRLEKNYKETKYRENGSFDQPFKKVKVDNIYVLPSVNLKYTMNNQTNFRLAAGKTYTRPVTMEAFPIEYINADGTATRGNNNLVNSDNYNLDLKYELFPTNKEILAIGLFGKKINNPIERTFIANAASGLITTFANSKEATLYGAEIEFIFDFARINKSLTDFSLGFNTSLMQTSVKSNNAFETHNNRELQGASKWLVNSDLKYQFNINKNWSNTVSLVYSVFGKRIFSVGTLPYDHVYELPVSKLDLVWASKLSQHFDLKFSADNILNPKVQFELGDNSSSTFAETSRTLNDYKRGVGFSLNLGYTF
ncbi:MAG: carboxypeptidase-like regulatory domain-containing protein [Bacteroidota bacterium]